MKKERKVIDAHLHIFGHCEFGDRLAHGIGDEPTQEYLTEKYYGRLGIEKGIVMGNGPLEEQGKNLGEYFYYSAGLDEKGSCIQTAPICTGDRKADVLTDSGEKNSKSPGIRRRKYADSEYIRFCRERGDHI